MAVVREFALPDLGEGLTEAEIIRWLVEVGDVVAVDQPVVEVETAKAAVEVPCPYGGVVTARYGDEGAELPVGAVLLTVAVGADAPAAGPGRDRGADAPPSGAGSGSGVGSGSGFGSGGGAGRGAAAGSAPAAEGSGNVLVGYGTGAPAARRRRVRPAAVGTGRGGPARAVPAGPAAAAVRSGSGAASCPAGSGEAVPEIWRPLDGSPDQAHARDAGAAAEGGPVAVISPLVRRLAREHGIDLRRLRGSGPDGLILRADVESAVRDGSAEPGGAPAAAPAPAPDASGAGTPYAAAGTSGQGLLADRVPLRGIRGAVADKLSRSRREIPDATAWVDADATELLAARAAMNAGGGPKISLLALFARICTAALARHPELNATVDTGSREIVRLPAVHLGFAAQTGRGLVVPVVRDAHTLGAEGLSAEFARLTGDAREGRLTPAQLTGGTFTLNNYGVFGVDGSTPIINHPEAAMLGVGRIAAKPWVHGGELAVRQVVQLSLTFDHRVCDGGTAGGFLRYVADCVERPAVLLRSL